MTTYHWHGDSTGSFGNQHNWFNDTDNKIDDGVPGAGDTAFITNATSITLGAGVTVANLTASGVPKLTGDFTVTGELIGGDLVGGDVEAGTMLQSIFAGKSLTAASIDGRSELNSGTVQTKLLGQASINGATVTTDRIARGTAGDPCGIMMTGGTLKAGTLTLSDAAATVGIADSFEITGGTATISGKATVTGNNNAAGFDLTYLIAAGGHLNLSGGLSLSGAGLFNDEAGAKTTAQDLVAGENGTGTVGVSGKGSVLTVTADLILGDKGNGVLTVTQGGALIVSGDLEAAQAAGSTSTMTIGDAGAAMTIHGEWRLGIAGTATATIHQAVTVQAEGGVSLGVNATGNGTLTVSDADTVLTIGTGAVTIGDAGKGTVTVQNGASLDAAASDVTVADQKKSTGTATVTGKASELLAGTLTLAGAGTGTLTVSAGAGLSVANDFILGKEADSKGTATITDLGSHLSAKGDTTIGVAGKGTLVGDGAALDLGSGQVTLGVEANSKGILTINGGSLALLGELLIGEAGSGTVQFGLGAKLAPGAGAKTPDITLAEKVGATGSLTIAGNGSSVSADALEVGVLGKATVSIATSGKLLVNSANIATAAISNNNSVSIDTAGIFSIATNLAIGEKGFATFSIAGAGQAAAEGEVSIGENTGAIGSVTVSGTVTNTTTHKTTASGLGFGTLLEIGGGGSGMLFIQQGALVAPVPAGKGVVEIAAKTGSIGKVTLTGAGSTLRGSELAVGGTAAKLGGSGSLSIGAGSIASFATATIWSSGSFSDAGTLTLTGGIGGNGALTVAGGGVLNLDGTGSKTISVSLTDNGAVTIEAGKAEFEKAAGGTGAFTVDQGAVLQFSGTIAKGLSIDFASTKGGELLLLDSRQFAGSVHGFGGKGTDEIDLRDINFNSGKFALNYTGTAKTGVLKVSDGSHTASLTMFGDYKKASFHASSDHAGGTLIVDPPIHPLLAA